jgi:hypothetical protein
MAIRIDVLGWNSMSDNAGRAGSRKGGQKVYILGVRVA